MQYSPFYTHNVEALTALKQPVAEWLAAQKPDLEAINSRIGKNRWGMLDIALKNGQYLFDGIPPGPLYNEWVPNEQNHSHATFIVGTNLGYGLNHILTNTPDGHKIIVVEPDADILTACLGQTDYTPWLRMGKLHFLPPDKDVLQAVIRRCDTQFLFGRIHLRLDMPSRQSSPEYAYWTRIIREQLESLTVELSTLHQKQDEMVGNEIANFRRAIADGSVNPLKNCAKGMKAILLGAGPSLADNGPLLAKTDHSALIVSNAQTLGAVQRTGIKPHLTVAIDYSKVMLRMYDTLDPEWCADIPLIYSTKMNPEVIKRYPGPTIPMWTLGGMASFIAGEDDLVLDAAGNVSVAIIRLLHWMGIREMSLIGQDYAWAGTQTHASGHHFAQQPEANPSTMVITNAYGETRHTTLPFITAARAMNSDFEQLNITAHNIYGGGYNFEAATNVTFEEALEKGCFHSDAGAMDNFRLQMLETSNGCEQPVFEERTPTWRTSLRHAQKRMEKLFKKPERNYPQIRKQLGDIHLFLRQDPVYMPYLYKEVMEIAGLRDATARYTPKEFITIKQVLKRVLEKVRHMDDTLGPRWLEQSGGHYVAQHNGESLTSSRGPLSDDMRAANAASTEQTAQQAHA